MSPQNKKQQPSAIFSDLTPQRNPFSREYFPFGSLYMLEQRESSVYIYSCYWHRDANNFKARILNTVFISTARSIIISIGKIMLIYIALPPNKNQASFFLLLPPKETLFPGNAPLSESLYLSEQKESSVYIYSCYWHRDANNFKARILNTVFISTARSIIISIGKIMLIYIALPPNKNQASFFLLLPPKETLFPGNAPLSESLYLSEQKESSVYIYSCYWHRDANNFKARILNTVFISTARSIIISIGKIMLIYIALPPNKNQASFFLLLPPKETLFPGNAPLSESLYLSEQKESSVYIYSCYWHRDANNFNAFEWGLVSLTL